MEQKRKDSIMSGDKVISTVEDNSASGVEKKET